jgi:hypothetical protein
MAERRSFGRAQAVEQLPVPDARSLRKSMLGYLEYQILIPISIIACALNGSEPQVHGSTTGYEHPQVDFSVGARA